MSNQDIFQQQIQVLSHYQKAMADLGYNTRLIEQFSDNSSLKIPILLIGLPKDFEGRDRTINFTFMMQDQDQDFDYLSLIQCYSPLSFSSNELTKLDQLEKMIIKINNQLPVGHFGLTNQSNLFYRYVISSEKWALIESETLQQLLLVFLHILDNFAPILENLITRLLPEI